MNKILIIKNFFNKRLKLKFDKKFQTLLDFYFANYDYYSAIIRRTYSHKGQEFWEDVRQELILKFFKHTEPYAEIKSPHGLVMRAIENKYNDLYNKKYNKSKRQIVFEKYYADQRKMEESENRLDLEKDKFLDVLNELDKYRPLYAEALDELAIILTKQEKFILLRTLPFQGYLPLCPEKLRQQFNTEFNCRWAHKKMANEMGRIAKKFMYYLYHKNCVVKNL